jgi:DNA-binding PadR family transcriptional regulator
MNASEKGSRRKSDDRLLGFAPGIYILLALAGGPANGMEIWWRIVGDTMGNYLRHSSMYDELKRLDRANFIERLGQRWRLTAEGERRLRLEVSTLNRLSEVARRRQLW